MFQCETVVAGEYDHRVVHGVVLLFLHGVWRLHGRHLEVVVKRTDTQVTVFSLEHRNLSLHRFMSWEIKSTFSFHKVLILPPYTASTCDGASEDLPN